MEVPKDTFPAVDLSGTLEELLTTYHELNVDFVEMVDGPPTALEFSRRVAANRPVVFKRCVNDWTAVEKWRPEYLRAKLGTQDIPVAQTPHGNADSVVTNPADGREYFVKPHESTEPFGSYLDYLLSQHAGRAAPGAVKYAQSQDNNLAKEFSALASDVPADLAWATTALAKPPDAVNVWIGGEASVSALHKDNYENVYCQIAGQKRFVLISPFEAACVRERSLPAATYVPRAHGGFDVVPDVPASEVPFWPTVDPDEREEREEEEEEEDWWRLCRPLRVALEPGDVLYLPAMWYHKVSQRCGEDGICCAVNYWYDMEFGGSFYPAVSFARNITRLLETRSQ